MRIRVGTLDARLVTHKQIGSRGLLSAATVKAKVARAKRFKPKPKIESKWIRTGELTELATLEVTGFGLLSKNRTMRMHWAALRRYTDTLAKIVAAARPRPDLTGHAMLHVKLLRTSGGAPLDEDGIAACFKQVLDILRQPTPAERVTITGHGLRLGVIASDDPGRLRLASCEQRPWCSTPGFRVSFHRQVDATPASA